MFLRVRLSAHQQEVFFSRIATITVSGLLRVHGTVLVLQLGLSGSVILVGFDDINRAFSLREDYDAIIDNLFSSIGRLCP